MPLRLRSAGGGSVLLKPPVALAADVSMEVPGYEGAKLLTNKTPGAVLQVVSTEYRDLFSTTSGTPVDVPGFAATITPLSANSKILVNVSIAFGFAQDCYPYALILRNGISLSTGNTATGNQRNVFLGGFGTNASAATPWRMHHASKTFMDTPASTDALTYKIQLASPYIGAGYINRQDQAQDAAYIQRPTSTITLMEIAA